MRPSQWIALLITALVGVLWVFIGQNWLFLYVFPGLLGPVVPTFLNTGSSPSFTVLWISCIVALALWIVTAANRRTRSAADVIRMQTAWWITAVLLTVLGGLYQLFFTVFIWMIRDESPIQGSGISYYPLPPAGWVLVLTMVVFNVLLLFWLPSLLATPRSHRLVVPGAVTLIGDR
jgi:hypothetical protein